APGDAEAGAGTDQPPARNARAPRARGLPAACRLPRTRWDTPDARSGFRAPATARAAGAAAPLQPRTRALDSLLADSPRQLPARADGDPRTPSQTGSSERPRGC